MSTIAIGTIHAIPDDLQSMLRDNPASLNTWNLATPLARNEWICLILSAKKETTRVRRLERTRSQLAMGQRRPCCWEGCPHREKNGK